MTHCSGPRQKPLTALATAGSKREGPCRARARKKLKKAEKKLKAADPKNDTGICTSYNYSKNISKMAKGYVSGLLLQSIYSSTDFNYKQSVNLVRRSQDD